jgi:hypothetical protein
MPALLRSVAHGSSGLQPALCEPAKSHQIQTEATAVFGICDAGFFSKEKLPFAQRVEALDRKATAVFITR